MPYHSKMLAGRLRAVLFAYLCAVKPWPALRGAAFRMPPCLSPAIAKGCVMFLYNDYSAYLRGLFGCKVQKISVNAGLSCPNRDGTLGTGGCTYCNNLSFSPEYCDSSKPVAEQLSEGVRFFSRKYPQMKYLAYFQSYTGTYSSLDGLKRMYEQALSVDGVLGIVIGTRPDCVSPGLVRYLSELSRQAYVIVEYGVESIDDAILRRVNRGHDYATAERAVMMTAEAGVHVGIHLMLGFPGDTVEAILRQPAVVSRLPVTTLKLHQLQVIRGTRLAREFEASPGAFPSFTVDEYADLVARYVEMLRPSIVLERFVAQSPGPLLVSPRWGIKNYEFAEKLKKKLLERGSWQGKLYEDQEK